MIYDDLRPYIDRVTKALGWPSSFHVFRVPFSIVPTDLSDLACKLTPRRDGIVACEWARMPYPTIGVVSCANEPAVTIVSRRPGVPSRRWPDDPPDEAWEIVRIQRRGPAVAIAASLLSKLESGRLVRDPDREIVWSRRLTAIANAVPTAMLPPALNTRDAREEAASALYPVTATLALLNTKNIVAEEVRPADALQRARVRRGKLPLVSYHILKVRPVLRRRATRDDDAPTGPPIALHWTAGHWKHYSPEKRLFGKHVGAYWWQPHLAGRAPRFVDKDYAVSV